MYLHTRTHTRCGDDEAPASYACRCSTSTHHTCPQQQYACPETRCLPCTPTLFCPPKTYTPPTMPPATHSPGQDHTTLPLPDTLTEHHQNVHTACSSIKIQRSPSPRTDSQCLDLNCQPLKPLKQKKNHSFFSRQRQLLSLGTHHLAPHHSLNSVACGSPMDGKQHPCCRHPATRQARQTTITTQKNLRDPLRKALKKAGKEQRASAPNNLPPITTTQNLSPQKRASKAGNRGLLLRRPASVLPSPSCCPS